MRLLRSLREDSRDLADAETEPEAQVAGRGAAVVTLRPALKSDSSIDDGSSGDARVVAVLSGAMRFK